MITRDPIDVAELTERVSAPANGAVVVFLGIVREQNDGRPVTGMNYDAYEVMATEVLDDILVHAARSLGTDTIAAVHRIGELTIGEVSVAIAAGSPHRASAFDVTRYIIEEIKSRLPVWKEERYADGTAAWLDGVVPPLSSERT